MFLIFADRPVAEDEKPERFQVAKRVMSRDRETLTYYSVTPDPGEVTGTIQMYRDDGFLLAEDDADGYDRQIYEGRTLTLTNVPEPDPGDEPNWYIPTAEQSAVVMMRSSFAMQAASMEDEEILLCSGLANDWAPGNHKVGEVFNTRDGVHAEGEVWDQTWEVFQDYDNAVFPDIKPGNSAWYTFNRPLHGKSRETARPFVAVQGAHDMYREDEYTVWTDQKVYRCVKDTAYSPADQPEAWEVVA